MTLPRRVTCHEVLGHDWTWQVASCEPGAANTPADLDTLPLAWHSAEVPGTAASALMRSNQWAPGDQRDFDRDDWWYRTEFPGPGSAKGERTVLVFDGLATLADVWLNGAKVLESDNMFVRHEIDVSDALRPVNHLAIRFRSLTRALAARRPRPQWKTRLVEQQNLRWFRTTLLGRIPGWSAGPAAVGPWRPITLERRRSILIEAIELRSQLDGTDGVVRLRGAVRWTGGARPTSWSLKVGAVQIPVAPTERDGVLMLDATARIAKASLWWPHTHGTPHLYDVSLQVGDLSIDLGAVGFRTVELRTDGGQFTFVVNGVPIFCRGACWTVADTIRLAGEGEQYASLLALAVAGGLNMIRVGGTMIYESADFFARCDAWGILVWQDCMFANMDYPAGDSAFVSSVNLELDQQFSRLQQHPSLVAVCGGSEVEQQAAMLGQPRERWSNELYQRLVPEALARHCPDTPYIPSSPTGGTFPFQARTGLTHYYGVGAYLQPLTDARRAEVRFTSETLGFSNIPETATIDAMLAPGQSPFHHPKWKAAVPRDSGAGWDFEDVRDHYFKLLFRLEPAEVRYADMDRYLTLSRLVASEVMHSVFGEWRRPASTCRGGLVWFYRDLVPGAGWGIIDASARPKAAYYGLKRAAQPVAIFVSDEGINGLWAQAVNDSGATIAARVGVALYRDGFRLVGSGAVDLSLGPRSAVELHLDGLLEGFVDTTYTYRFGPPGHDVTVVTLTNLASGEILSQAFHHPLGMPNARRGDLGLAASVVAGPRRGYAVEIATERFAFGVSIEGEGCLAEDNYFHLAPGSRRVIQIGTDRPDMVPKLWISAANGTDPVRADVAPGTSTIR